MVKVLQRLLMAMAFIFLLSPSAYAGEEMEAGTVLTEDSYVFTLEEAERLKERMEELEGKEVDLAEAQEEIEAYKELDQNQKNQIEIYQINEELYQKKETELGKIIAIQDQSMTQYQKKEKWNRVENAALFAGGVAVTVAVFIIIDEISDNVIDDQITTGTQVSGKTLFTF